MISATDESGVSALDGTRADNWFATIRAGLVAVVAGLLIPQAGSVVATCFRSVRYLTVTSVLTLSGWAVLMLGAWCTTAAIEQRVLSARAERLGWLARGATAIATLASVVSVLRVFFRIEIAPWQGLVVSGLPEVCFLVGAPCLALHWSALSARLSCRKLAAQFCVWAWLFVPVEVIRQLYGVASAWQMAYWRLNGAWPPRDLPMSRLHAWTLYPALFGAALLALWWLVLVAALFLRLRSRRPPDSTPLN